MENRPQKRNKCSICKEEGHNRRACPQNGQTAAPHSNSAVVRAPSVRAPPLPLIPPQILDTLSYALIDVESLGFGVTGNKILQFAAIFLDSKGKSLEQNMLENVNPGVPIPPHSTRIHGLTNQILANAPSMKDISSVIVNKFDVALRGNDTILVTHNASSLDVPLLIAELDRHGKKLPSNVKYVIDTRRLAELVLKNKPNPPENFKLGTLVKHITGNELTGAHDALVDTKGMAEVFLSPTSGTPESIKLFRLIRFIRGTRPERMPLRPPQLMEKTRKPKGILLLFLRKKMKILMTRIGIPRIPMPRLGPLILGEQPQRISTPQPLFMA